MNRALPLFIALMVSAPSVMSSGDSAQVLHPQQLQSYVANVMQVANSAGHASSPLVGYGNVSLRVSVQTKSGGAEIHAHLDDLMIVQQGKATLITGGTLIQRQELANGGAKGAGIQNGVSQEINAGDVILIPAGVPHQLVIPAGTVYAALVAKVKEPE